MTEGVKKVNEMFGLDLSVEYRYKDEEVENAVQSDNVNTGAV